MVDVADCVHYLLHNPRDFNQLTLMRDESCTFCDWACYIDGYRVIGSNPMISMVVEAHCKGTEEVEVVESIRIFEEWLDVGHLGDDDHVSDIVRKN